MNGRVRSALAVFILLLSCRYSFCQPAVEEDVKALENRMTVFIQEKYLAPLKKNPENTKLRNELGITYALTGKTDNAEQEFRKVLSMEPGNNCAMNNLANVYLMRGDTILAKQGYVEAQKSAPADIGVMFNLGLLSYLSGNQEEAETFFSSALAQPEGLRHVSSFLGIDLGEKQEKAGTLTRKEVEEMLKKTLKKIPAKKAKKEPTPASTSIIGGARGQEFADELCQMLYWRK